MKHDVGGRSRIQKMAIAFFASFLTVFLALQIFDWMGGADDAQDLSHGVLAEAIAEGERFVLANPDDFESLLMLASLYGHAENSDRQIHWAKRAVELDEGRPEAWVLLGNGLGLAGHKDEARRAFEKAIEIEPGNMPALQGLNVIGGDIR